MSELKTNKISPATLTDVVLGDSGDTFTIPTGVTLAGSGASLTGLTAANITGTLPAISGANLTNLPGGGPTEIDRWILTSNFVNGAVATTITSNLARYAHNGWLNEGTGMTESSGIFTFPSTGMWQIFFNLFIQRNSTVSHINSNIMASTDSGSSYVPLGESGQGWGGNPTNSVLEMGLFNVTNASTARVKFETSASSTAITFYGNSQYQKTGFTFIRLGDFTS